MKQSLLVILFSIVYNMAFSQPYKTIKTQTPYKWMVNVSWNVIDDDGRPFTGMFDVANTWQTEYFPTKFQLIVI